MRDSLEKMPGKSDSRPVAERFAKTLDKLEHSKGQTPELVIPDLAVLAPDQGSRLIERALLLPNAHLRVPSGQETLRLAQKLALKNIQRLKSPPWDLVSTPEAVELFEALQKKFPAEPKDQKTPNTEFERTGVPGVEVEYPDTGERQRAQACYACGLVLRGRRAEAVAYALKLDQRSIEALAGQISKEANSEAFAFMGELLAQKPELKLWNEYVDVALSAGNAAQMIELLNKQAQQKRTPAVLGALIKVYLAADQPEKAVPLVRELMGTRPETPVGRRGFMFMEQSQPVDRALELAQLGILLKNDSWAKEGLNAAIKFLKENPESSLYRSNRICELLIQAKRYHDAEELQEWVLQTAIKAQGNYSNPLIPEALAGLARIYSTAGRYDDVLLLIERAPWWGAPDLARLGSVGANETSLFYLVAQALHRAGRDADAERILKARLSVAGGEDRCYALLVEIAGQALIPWLDELYARDRFEERPLIWKAVLQLKDGKVAEAESTIREALKVDPTDGEQPKGDRVRAYGVLADVLSAKGDEKNAKFFRDVVQSVRVAEEGDEFNEAGLLERSFVQYDKAQALFADAYCVQWRLAKRLAAMGKKAEAEEHYRIAFERMPEQFGKVASLCFGCEGIFEESDRRTIAEKVLLQLESQGPKRPQVYYLLGQLRSAQNRAQEAYSYYRKAVDMDPGYLDAWEKIYSLSDVIFMSQREQDELALKALAMDPLQHHFQANLSGVFDLKNLWLTLEGNRKFYLPAPDTLLPLPASKAALEEKEKSAGPAMDAYLSAMRSTYDRQRELASPAMAIVGQDLVRVLSSYWQSALQTY